MRRIGGAAGGMALALILPWVLAGCSQVEQGRQEVRNASARYYDSVGETGRRLGAPWGGPRPSWPDDSGLTVTRVVGPNPPVSALTTEAGNVWPAQEGPRSTLANPDAALRGIPNYRSDGASPAATGEPRRPPRGSSTPPNSRSLNPPPSFEERMPPMSSAPPRPTEPLPRRADGRPLVTPQGPGVTTGGTDRIQNYTIPGVGSGTAIRDGNTTTLIGPGGQITTMPNPR
jgi:hypothetical protein